MPDMKQGSARISEGTKHHAWPASQVGDIRATATANDRDSNAAENLKRWPSLSFSVTGHGGRVSQVMPAVANEASTSLLAVPSPSWAGQGRLS